MKRITLGVGLSLLSFVTITMFQNCAQPGALQMSEQEAYAAGAMDIVAMGAIEDTDLTIEAPIETTQSPAPTTGSDTESPEVAPAPSAPVISSTNNRDEEIAAPAPTPAPTPEESVQVVDSMPSYPTPAPAPSLGSDNETPEMPVAPAPAPVIEQVVVAPTPEAPAPAPAPEQSPAPVIEQVAAPAPAPSIEQAPTPAPAPEAPVVTSQPQPEDSDIQPQPELQPAVCSKERDMMTDIKLNVASIQGVDLKGVQITIVDQSPFITMESRKIKIKASKDAVLDKVNLVLDQSGNLVLFSNNTYAELKTPSAQQSGLKVHLDSAISMKAGKTYELFLQFELADQLVIAGKKCLFKPVIHTGNLSLAAQ